jgi:hypothetical protein
MPRSRSQYERWNGRFFYYALVRRGGAAVGQRPKTRMAILTDCTFEGDRLVSAKGFIGAADLTGWSKSKYGVEVDDIVYKWRSRPSTETIRRQQRKMAVQPAEPAGA